jgi:crotonobetainyl-CoA:carnitine CoA-transferase CaiB-like acyl-CoA transferase
MKANDILNKIKNIVGVELSESKIELAEITLENGTVLVAESFEAGKSIFIKTEEEEIALPIGEYELEDGKILVVTEEGLIDSIKEAAKEEEVAEEELSEESVTEEVETELEEEEMKYVTKEEFSLAMNELKEMIEKMGNKEEKEELTKEAEQVEMSAEPIKHNPEEKKQKVNFKIGGSRTTTTMDRVYGKIFNNN